MTTVPNRAVADVPTRNRGIKRKLAEGTAIDVSDCPREGQYYVLDQVIEGKDYCDGKRGAWIWSIGKRRRDGKILASLRTDLYQHRDFICLWLR
jgi:hypothetical protein